LALPIISVSLIAYTLCEKIYVGLKVAANRMLYLHGDQMKHICLVEKEKLIRTKVNKEVSNVNG